MKQMAATTVVGIALASTATAGGLDRTNQPIGIIFEEGNYLEFSVSHTTPDITGTDLIVGGDIDNVGEDFTLGAAGLKVDLSEAFSISFIGEQPFGSDVFYPGDGATSALGGTFAYADTFSYTTIGRYKFNDTFSVHGGLRYQEISDASITLSGLAYGALSGYNTDFGSDGAFGFVVGAAYEIPDIALRVALTYNSEITHDLPTVESISGVVVAAPSFTEISSPESINLDWQTGIAPGTLLFGSVRYAKWSDLIISPDFFDAAVDPTESGSSISQLDDVTSYSIGVGRQFTENFAGSVSIGYEDGGADDLVSPLAPTNGQSSIALAGSYDFDSGLRLSGGVRYTMLGDARAETGTPDTARGDFSDNTAVSVGLRVGYSF
ncbi:MAG: outer membrane protein transport protein [Pseudomonadota bacterium]